MYIILPLVLKWGMCMYVLASCPGLPHRGMRLMCRHAFPCVKPEHVQSTTSYTFTSWHATTNSVGLVGKFWVMLDKGHAVKMKQSKRHDYIVRDSKLRVDYYRRPALQYYMFNVNIGCSIYFSWRLKRPRAFAAQASKNWSRRLHGGGAQPSIGSPVLRFQSNEARSRPAAEELYRARKRTD